MISSSSSSSDITTVFAFLALITISASGVSLITIPRCSGVPAVRLFSSRLSSCSASDSRLWRPIPLPPAVSCPSVSAPLLACVIPLPVLLCSPSSIRYTCALIFVQPAVCLSSFHCSILLSFFATFFVFSAALLCAASSACTFPIPSTLRNLKVVLKVFSFHSSKSRTACFFSSWPFSVLRIASLSCSTASVSVSGCFSSASFASPCTSLLKVFHISIPPRTVRAPSLATAL